MKHNRDRHRPSPGRLHAPETRLLRIWWVGAVALLTLWLVAGYGCAPTSTPIEPASATQVASVSAGPTPCTSRYRDASMGFRLDYPCEFGVSQLEHGPCSGDPGRLCDSVLFQTTDPHGNTYGLTVFRYWPAAGNTITDTVEYSLRDVASSSRDQIDTRCCLTVGGETAMEVTYPATAQDRFRNRQLSALHEGGEYWLVFWWGVPFQPEGVTDLPSGSVAQSTFNTCLRTFAFIPVAETPTPPPPMPTAVPTPTATATATSSPPRSGEDGEISIESVYVSSSRIVFSGRSTLPEGSCLHTQLLADGEPLAWWPDEACAMVNANGAWQIAVKLGAADAPTRLDSTLGYMLRAWSPLSSSSPVEFRFDLAGPPAPD